MSRKRTKSDIKNENNIIIENKDSIIIENEDNIKIKSPLQDKKSNDIYPRDEIYPLPLNSNHNYLKIITWNVNGLTALITKKLSVLTNLIVQVNPDILCLQETKIQENLVDDYKNLLDGYNSYWNCSTVKKGYAGTVMFIKKSILLNNSSTNEVTSTTTTSKKQQSKLTSLWKTKDNISSIPNTNDLDITTTTNNNNNNNNSSNANNNSLIKLDKISVDFEDEAKCFHGEGRTITAEFDNFILVACYVPNSGEGLVRLDYRTKQWDPWIREYMNKLNKRKPVIFTGDLNVAHLDLDIHNPDAKHISKQAGLTPQERDSHTTLLLETNFQDAFRTLYQDAKGQFTYWSQRTFARPVNKGLRLDYFICSKDMFPTFPTNTSTIQTQITNNTTTTTNKESNHNNKNNSIHKYSPMVYDCYILHKETIGCSDHCPVVLVIKL